MHPRVTSSKPAAPEPFSQFTRWFEEAKARVPIDPNAMLLSTVGADGRPSARVVLLKDFSPEGFVFYTNLQSRKGHDLERVPFAALTFHWRELERQVRIEGAVEPVTGAEADAYFASRARGSQVGAWASRQSEVLERREILEARVAEVEARYAGATIPRPPFWSGLRVRPDRIELWTARVSRLHDRQVFRREGNGPWQVETLFP